MWAVVSTWKMSYDGLKKAADELKNNADCKDAVVSGIQVVESDLEITSVGTGGLPNREGVIQLDGAFMDGTTLQFGAVADVENIPSAVALAKSIAYDNFNNFIVGAGAKKEAVRKNMGLIDLSSPLSEKKFKEDGQKQLANIHSYSDSHDTVGMVALDKNGHMVSATSTSGLFMKKDGRVGDSPIIGSGFYCDDEIGGAAATGVGEDIMKGVLCYEIVRKMGEGIDVQTAAQSSVEHLHAQLVRRIGKAREISVVAMDNKGNIGIGTNCQFSYCLAKENGETKMYEADYIDDKLVIKKAED